MSCDVGGSVNWDEAPLKMLKHGNRHTALHVRRSAVGDFDCS